VLLCMNGLHNKKYKKKNRELFQFEILLE
jgi:hypothetical protein